MDTETQVKGGREDIHPQPPSRESFGAGSRLQLNVLEHAECGSYFMTERGRGCYKLETPTCQNKLPFEFEQISFNEEDETIMKARP